MWLARIFISMCLGDRQHVPSVDPHTIIRYLVDASIKGHADAMYMLGVASFRVDPCRQIISERQARVWMEKAAAKSCIFAHVFQSSSDSKPEVYMDKVKEGKTVEYSIDLGAITASSMVDMLQRHTLSQSPPPSPPKRCKIRSFAVSPSTKQPPGKESNLLKGRRAQALA